MFVLSVSADNGDAAIDQSRCADIAVRFDGASLLTLGIGGEQRIPCDFLVVATGTRPASGYPTSTASPSGPAMWAYSRPPRFAGSAA